MKAIMFTMPLVVSTFSFASQFPSIDQYYNSRADQLFTWQDAKPMVLLQGTSFEKNRWVWHGQLNGKNIAIETGRKQIHLNAGGKTTRLPLAKASTPRRDDHFSAGMDLRGIRYYVHQDKEAKNSLICIDSPLPTTSRESPYAQIYLLVSPFNNARLIKQPSLNASCTSLIKRDGHVYLPISVMATPRLGGSVTISYVDITPPHRPLADGTVDIVLSGKQAD